MKLRELLRILERPSIGRQFALRILMFSSVVTLVSTVLQLTLEFKRDVTIIESVLGQIRKSYSNSLAGSLWVTSQKDVQLQVNGAFRLPDVQYLEVRSDQGQIVAVAGKVQEQRILRQETPLYFEYLGKQVFVGTLVAVASLESAYQHIADKVVVILISQTIKTFLVSMFILFLFQRLVGRHLDNIARHSELIAAGAESQPLALERKCAPGPYKDELDRMISAFNSMNLRMAKAYAELQRFAEITAHHLQEPARRIASYAERLTMQLAGRIDDAQTRLSLEYIGQQARRQQYLLRDVEHYLAADQPRGEVRVIDTRRLVAEMLEKMAGRIGQAGAEVTLGDLPAACIDAARLNDMFAVALDNALEHGCGERSPHIAIAGERLENRVRYSVADNGPGVEAEYRERVFRVFERLSKSGAGSGTGIGLAILRRVAESTGGRAWIEETPGGGCRVLFELPAGDFVGAGSG
ncbi:MAG: ATP-binding protein [Sulfuricellaceae bacterium]